MTTHSGLSLAKGVVVENMGTTVLVMIPGQHDVLTLTGPAADVVNAVVAGQAVSKDLEPEVELLLSAGVLTSPMSRRNLLRAGAIGAGAGIAVLTMPSVAAASSPGGGTSGGAGGGGNNSGGGASADFIRQRTEGTSGQIIKVGVVFQNPPSGITNAFPDVGEDGVPLVFEFGGQTQTFTVRNRFGGREFETPSIASDSAAIIDSAFFLGAKITITLTVDGQPRTFVSNPS